MQAQVKKMYPKKKVEMIERLQKLFTSYNYVAIINLHKVRSNQIGQLRKKLADRAVFLGVKNRIAIKTMEGKDIAKLADYIRGQSLLLFFNMDPFELNMMLEKNKVMLAAKAGDIATQDIVVPAGNTGLQAGPILSDFRELKIATRIETGSVFINKDTIVAKKGEVISGKLASLLSKLSIKPIESGIIISAVYFNGMVIKGDDLRVDLEVIRENLARAHSEAYTLAYEVQYPDKEVLPAIIADRYVKARKLSIESGFVTEENVKEILIDREAKASKLRQAAS
ncbi:MAG: 50S ribosomal protein L10 [Conexivisphaerales archaeon]